MPILDHFGILAPYYDRLIRLKQVDQLARLAALPVDGYVLDAGGGTGRVAHAIKGFARQVVVADLSLGMLQQAKTKNSLWLACTHTEKLPFLDATFDRIIMVDALHHVCDHAETARELWRVLKPGGRILIEEPDVRTLAVKMVALFEKIALMRSHFLVPASIEKLFLFPQAQTRIEVDGFNAWVVVDKLPE